LGIKHPQTVSLKQINQAFGNLPAENIRQDEKIFVRMADEDFNTIFGSTTSLDYVMDDVR
jgi:hypothetical protein